jgi:hypothetical protein
MSSWNFNSSPTPPSTQNTTVRPSPTFLPIVPQPVGESYFGIPYDPGVWKLLESDQEHIPPSLGYISDSYCSMAVNSSDADLSIFTMVDKTIVLGERTWTRRYFLDIHNTYIFEVYFTDDYPNEFYNQLDEGGYHSTGGIRLLGLYETCRQAMQKLLAGMP